MKVPTDEERILVRIDYLKRTKPKNWQRKVARLCRQLWYLENEQDRDIEWHGTEDLGRHTKPRVAP